MIQQAPNPDISNQCERIIQLAEKATPTPYKPGWMSNSGAYYETKAHICGPNGEGLSNSMEFIAESANFAPAAAVALKACIEIFTQLEQNGQKFSVASMKGSAGLNAIAKAFSEGAGLRSGIPKSDNALPAPKGFPNE